jgi:plasmid stabilization system protein ParE
LAVTTRTVLTRRARIDLNGIYEWILNDSGERRARAITGRIDKTMSRLAAFPKSGRVRTEYPGQPRSFAVSPWVIFYRPLTEGNGVEILRVLDGRQDLSRILGGDQC